MSNRAFFKVCSIIARVYIPVRLVAYHNMEVLWCLFFCHSTGGLKMGPEYVTRFTMNDLFRNSYTCSLIGDQSQNEQSICDHLSNFNISDIMRNTKNILD